MDDQRVFIIEGEEPGWLAVRRTLAALPGISVAGSAASQRTAAQHVPEICPDAVLAAREVEGESIIPLLRRLRPALPQTTFVLLADDYDPAELLALDDVGISGYLLWRDLRGRRLEIVLHAALVGGVVVISDPVAAAYVMAQRQRLQPEPVPELSERERAVLRHLGEGLTQREIARLLGVHVRTVEAVVARLKRELGATSEFTLAVQAMRRGLLR